MCQMGFYLELDQINNIHHHIKGGFLQKEEFLLQCVWQTCRLILGIFAELRKKETELSQIHHLGLAENMSLNHVLLSCLDFAVMYPID